MMETTCFYVTLISGRVVRVLQDIGARGWSVFPTSLSVKGELLETYGLSVEGRCGPLVRSASRPATEAEFPLVGAKVGIIFDKEQWDGSDVFMPTDTAHVLITGEVREALISSKISNVSITPCADVVVP